VIIQRKIKLIAFDLDGTLVKEDSSWGKIHKHFNTVESERRNLKLYLMGEISYKEFMRRDIASWPKPLRIDDIRRILLDYELTEGSIETIKELREMEISTAIISAGIDILAEDVAKKLGIDYVIANGLEVDENGLLTGEGIERVDLLRKDKAFINLVKQLGIDLRETVAVGDSWYDWTLLRCSGVGIALGNDPELLRTADLSANSIREIPFIIRKISLFL